MTTTLIVPVIGSTEFPTAEDGYWPISVPFGSGEIEVDFNSEGSEMTAPLLAKVEPFIRQLSEFDKAARSAISSDFTRDEDSPSHMYLSHHLDELDSETVAQCFGPDGPYGLDQLLSALRLKRIGLYPEGDSYVATFDYTIDEDITQYILAIEFDAAGDVISVSMDS